MDPKNWHEFLTAVWCKRATPTGLIACILCLTAAILPVLLLIEKLNQPFLPWWLSVFLPIMGVPLWFWWRKLPPKSHNDKSHIFLAPTCEDDCLDLVARLARQLKREIRRKGLGDKVELQLLPTNHGVINDTEAGALLERLGGGVVVYGQYKKGNQTDKPTHGFDRITFTLRAKKSPVDLELNAAGQRALMEGRTFQVDEGNSFRAEEEVARHLTEVAVFLVGSSLLMSGEVEKSAELFDELRRAPVSRSRAFHDTLRASVAVSLLYAAQFIYDKKVAGHFSNHSFDLAARECRALLDRCSSICTTKPPAWQALDAIMNFHYGNVDAAIETWKQMRSSDPLGGCLSLGFLQLWRGAEQEALDEYRTASSCTYRADTVKSVLSFLGGVILGAPHKPELYWASGFVNDYFFDEKMAIKDYEEFLGKRGGTFPLLAQYADKRLSILKGGQRDLVPGEKRMDRLQAAQENVTKRKQQTKVANRRKRKNKRKRKKR